VTRSSNKARPSKSLHGELCRSSSSSESENRNRNVLDDMIRNNEEKQVKEYCRLEKNVKSGAHQFLKKGMVGKPANSWGKKHDYEDTFKVVDEEWVPDLNKLI
jgi:hypothetical protein